MRALLPAAETQSAGGRTFWSGRIAGHEVVAAQSGIGKVAAATTTTLLIQHFGARRVLFTGVAGGLHAAARVGDIVVGNACLQHDMDASPLFPRHELPGYGLARLPANAWLVRALSQAAREVLGNPEGFLDPELVAAFGLQEPQVHEGLLVSGDRFIASAAESAALRAALPDALAVDMESAAVAQVCHDFGVPLGVVRTVSDRADDSAHVDFPRFLEGVARHYSALVVERALRLI